MRPAATVLGQGRNVHRLQALADPVVERACPAFCRGVEAVVPGAVARLFTTVRDDGISRRTNSRGTANRDMSSDAAAGNEIRTMGPCRALTSL